ncbi:MAG: hypothetical protein P4L83_21635 [Nevskia sp.]|nr:hypothetical protein [Nevskia sp.]
MTIRAAIPALACALALSACAIGNRYDYSDASGTLNYKSQGQHVTVAVWDQRRYVVSGNKDPDFVGLQRANVGLPFDVGTASHRPLAWDMDDALVRSLAAADFGATPVMLTPRDSQATAMAALLRGKPQRVLLLRMDDWESDTYKNPMVTYDLTLNVYDASGRRLTSKNLKGNEALQGSLINPGARAREEVPDTFRRKIELLLNAPEVAAALR